MDRWFEEGLEGRIEDKEIKDKVKEKIEDHRQLQMDDQADHSHQFVHHRERYDARPI